MVSLFAWETVFTKLAQLAFIIFYFFPVNSMLVTSTISLEFGGSKPRPFFTADEWQLPGGKATFRCPQLKKTVSMQARAMPVTPVTALISCTH